MNIEDSKNKIKIPDIWKLYGLPGECPNHGLISSPIREDYNPSLSIFGDGRCFKDHATDQGGDVISFIAYIRDISNDDATREFVAYVSGEKTEFLNQAYKPSCFSTSSSIEISESRDRWPDLTESIDHCRTLAQLRLLDAAGLFKAQESGCLRFAIWKGRLSWIICDEKQKVAQARRLDGEFWTEIDAKSWNLPGSSGGIIGLESVTKAPPTSRVLLVEGGPDFLAAQCSCLRARSWGLSLDWLPLGILGAARNFDENQIKQLAGRRILILAHDDESNSGVNAAKRWSQQLAAAGCLVETVLAEEVGKEAGNSRIADLNDLFIHASSETDRILQLILSDSATSISKHIFCEPRGKPKPTRYMAFLNSVFTAKDLATMEVPRKRRILGQWFREGDIGILYAPRGLGKTWMVNMIAKAISSGESVGEWEAGEGPLKVLIIDGEMSLQQTKERYYLLGMDNERIALLHHEHLFSQTDQSINIAEKDTQDAITQLVREGGFSVVIFDNLSTLSAGLKENDSDDWELMSSWLIRLRRLNVSVIQVAHANKSGTLRGTSRKEDATNWILALKPDPDATEKNGACFVSTFEKNRNATDVEAPQLRWFIQKGDPVTCECSKQSSLDLMLAFIRDGLNSNKELAEELGLSKGAISKMARKLEDQGEIQINNGKYRPIAK